MVNYHNLGGIVLAEQQKTAELYMLEYPQTAITIVEKAKRTLSGATEIQ